MDAHGESFYEPIDGVDSTFLVPCIVDELLEVRDVLVNLVAFQFDGFQGDAGAVFFL